VCRRVDDIDIISGAVRLDNAHLARCRCCRRLEVAPHPRRQGLPFGIVLRGPVFSAVVAGISAGFSRQRMKEQLALEWIARRDSRSYDLEILSRILLVPCGAARGKGLQTHRRSRRVTGDAARMSDTLRCEDRLNPGLEILVIQRWRCCGLLSKQQGEDRT